MKNILVKLIYGIVAIEVAAGLWLMFMAYFVHTFNLITGVSVDGLGRQLEPSPLLAHLIFGAERLWAGWGYFALDAVVFFGGVAAGSALLDLASKLQSNQDD